MKDLDEIYMLGTFNKQILQHITFSSVFYVKNPSAAKF
jgi:hypothetical protein